MVEPRVDIVAKAIGLFDRNCVGIYRNQTVKRRLVASEMRAADSSEACV